MEKMEDIDEWKVEKTKDKHKLKDFVGRLSDKVQYAHFGNKRQWLKRLLTKILLDIYLLYFNTLWKKRLLKK